MNTLKSPASMATISGRPSLFRFWMLSKLLTAQKGVTSLSTYVFLHSIRLQSRHRQSGRIHAQSARVLHGNSQRLRNRRQSGHRSGSGRRSAYVDHLYAQQIRWFRYCGERLLCTQRCPETYPANRFVRLSGGRETDFTVPGHIQRYGRIRDASVCVYENVPVHWIAGIVHRV